MGSACTARCVTVAFRVPVRVSWVAKGAHGRLGGDIRLRGLAATALLVCAGVVVVLVMAWYLRTASVASGGSNYIPFAWLCLSFFLS